MILKVPCSLEEQSLSYAEFTRRKFDNMIVQDKLMGSDSEFVEECVTFNILDPNEQFSILLKKMYPEYILIS